MKTAIIISDGVKQIMLTPENDNEKEALQMITPNDDIELAIKKGSFSSPPTSAGYQVQMCEGEFLRAWDSPDSVMLVLTPKEKKEA